MIRGILDGWTDLASCQNLLFFAQLVNELLFDYSIPSNRIPTLNSHYLCNDAERTIKGIEKQAVPEGTLKPIVEELYCSLENDRLYRRNEQKPLRLFAKYDVNKYRVVKNINDLNYYDQKTIVSALIEKYYLDDEYLNDLKTHIANIIRVNNAQEQGELFQLTKSLVTELVNKGYMPNYIYLKVNSFFFSSDSVINSPTQVNDFLSLFTFQKNDYTIVLIVEKALECLTDYFEHEHLTSEFQNRTSSEQEATFLLKTEDQRYLVVTKTSLDPFLAVEEVKLSVDHYISMFRLSDHNFDCDLELIKCGTYDQQNNFIFVDNTVSPVRRTTSPSSEQVAAKMRLSLLAFSKLSSTNSNLQYQALRSAIAFHSLSLSSTSEQNQLLDLWAIFEAVLDIGKFHVGDRVNQICTFLIPILKRRYVYVLFKQISDDIKRYNEAMYAQITAGSTSENQEVRKVYEFVVLEEHKTIREAFIISCSDLPLLRERLIYFNEHLNDSSGIYKFVEKHCNRVRWQIMRIYRNRNMIIHNGEATPYLKLLVENLHSYVDEFLDYVISNFAQGNSINSMMLELFTRETEWIAVFTKRNRPVDREIVDFIMNV